MVADEQTNGRGRLGNSFFSPPGGLYVSIVLRPTLPTSQAPLIGLAAGLACAEAVEQVAGLRPVLKWPNDLLLGGRKLSGILVELTAAVAVLGIGLNVNLSGRDFPNELRTTATSLSSELGRDVSRDELLTALLERLEERYLSLTSGGSSPLLAAWRAAPNILGQRLRARTGAQVLEGIAEDLDVDGALLLRLDGGDRRKLVAADVHLL